MKLPLDVGLSNTMHADSTATHGAAAPAASTAAAAAAPAAAAVPMAGLRFGLTLTGGDANIAATSGSELGIAIGGGVTEGSTTDGECRPAHVSANGDAVV